MTYRRFKNHAFRMEPTDDYETLLAQHQVGGRDWRLIDDTWYMDKPVSRMWVDKGDDIIDDFRKCFHVYVGESYNPNGQGLKVPIYFSRFPELAEVTANMETAAEGILFGFPPRDVASFISMQGDDISGNSEHLYQ